MGVERICQHTHTRVVKKEEEYDFKGEKITVISSIRECCDCGAVLNDPELTDETLRTVYDNYKKRHGMLSTEEIINTRQKYGLSQRAFAKLLGCTQATIVRYERGNVQDLSNDRAIRMMQRPEYVRHLLNEGKVDLTAKERSRLEERLSMLEGDSQMAQPMPSRETLLLSSFKDDKPNEYNGFVALDLQKVGGMVRFFAKHQVNLYKTKLMKLLWYADMMFCQEYSRGISGMRYVHQHYGPIPVKHETILALLVELGYITTQEDEYGETIQVAGGDTGAVFSDAEKAILQAVSDKFTGYTAKNISDHSHREAGYRETSQGEEISYKYALEMALA